MKTALVLGIVLVVLGALALIYQGVSYTKKEKVLDLGPLQASVEERKTLPLPPIVGVVLLAGGIVLIVAGTRKS